jgi:ribosome-associated toxin RatA of RatAB toxin-antitoxin module
MRSTESTASPEEVFAVAVDLARYPEWAAGVNAVEVLETDARGRPARARFEIEGFVKRISYELRYDYDEPRRMEWWAVPGDDIREMHGSYEFNPLEGGGTEIVYALRVEPAFTVPGFLRRQAEKQIVSSALRGLRRRAEGAQAGA